MSDWGEPGSRIPSPSLTLLIPPLPSLCQPYLSFCSPLSFCFIRYGHMIQDAVDVGSTGSEADQEQQPGAGGTPAGTPSRHSLLLLPAPTPPPPGPAQLSPFHGSNDVMATPPQTGSARSGGGSAFTPASSSSHQAAANAAVAPSPSVVGGVTLFSSAKTPTSSMITGEIGSLLCGSLGSLIGVPRPPHKAAFWAPQSTLNSITPKALRNSVPPDTPLLSPSAAARRATPAPAVRPAPIVPPPPPLVSSDSSPLPFCCSTSPPPGPSGL